MSSNPDKVLERAAGYVADMIDAIDRIEGYVDGYSRESFLADRRTVDAVIRNLEVIGEASKLVPESLHRLYTAAPWRVIADLRNQVIHEYRTVSFVVIWDTVQNDLPALKLALQRMLAVANAGR